MNETDYVKLEDTTENKTAETEAEKLRNTLDRLVEKNAVDNIKSDKPKNNEQIKPSGSLIEKVEKGFVKGVEEAIEKTSDVVADTAKMAGVAVLGVMISAAPESFPDEAREKFQDLMATTVEMSEEKDKRNVENELALALKAADTRVAEVDGQNPTLTEILEKASGGRLTLKDT
jgi:hypothetical protein